MKERKTRKSNGRLNGKLGTGDVADVLVLVAIVIFLLSYFKPELLLLDTVTNGGDTGSHNYPLHYMRDYLLPSLRLIGWSPDWYAGFPMFQFYFPMPFLIMALMSYAMPINIAFKIGTVLGTFVLPIAVYAAARMMKSKFPMPAIAAVLSLLFLFNTGNSMWGGNIPSTLAGEFSYSLSLSAAVVFLGLLYAGITGKEKSKKKSNIILVISAAIFAFATLCHAYPVFFAAFASLFFLFTRKEFKQNFVYLFKVYGLAFLLAAFWLVPMIAKIGYSSVYHYVWDIGSIEEIFPDMIKPLLLFSALGGLVVFRAKGGEMKRVLFFLYCIFIAFFLYCISSYIGVTDIRFIPFLQLFLVFPSAYSIGWFACKIGEAGRMRRHPIVSSIVAVAILVLVVASTMHFVSSNEKYIPFWIKWNYGGFETKENWQQLQNITSYLQSLPQARVVHEYSASHDKFGTPRTFESIPLFSGKPVLEGLNIESALTAPHVFVIQSEISITPTCPIPGLVCSKFDIRNATIHLRQFNVRYVVATTSQLKEALRMDGNYKSLATFDEIEIFELEPDERTGYASVAKYEPVLVQANGNEWKQYSLDWFRSASEVPLVFTSGISEADRARFATIYEYGEFQIGESKLPQYAIENCNISENVQNEAIELQLDGKCINKPVIVRVPYFPNWKVEGADRIYLVSPAFMLIYPQQSNVRIYYSYTSVDYAGMILTAVGMVVLIVVSLPAFGSLKFFLKFFSKPKL